VSKNAVGYSIIGVAFFHNGLPSVFSYSCGGLYRALASTGLSMFTNAIEHAEKTVKQTGRKHNMHLRCLKLNRGLSQMVGRC
jgi:hypothetical protein